MASIIVQRIGNALTASFQYSTRSRTLALSLTTTERLQRRRRSRTPFSYTFSTHSSAQQEASPAASAGAPKQPTSGAPTGVGSSSIFRGADHTSNRGDNVPANTVKTDRNIESDPPREPIREIQHSGLSDLPEAGIPPDADPAQVDWARSFHGLSTAAFPKEVADVLLAPIPTDDIEVKPDGIIYLPEIKYRRILNRSFGPGGWGLAPRGETIVTAKCVTREYALLANGRLISIARGEQEYFDNEGIPTATEGCKSNALMRCCKDLGVASELWDPRFVRKFIADNVREIWVEHVATKKRRKIHVRKNDSPRSPWKEVKSTGASGAFSN